MKQLSTCFIDGRINYTFSFTHILCSFCDKEGKGWDWEKVLITEKFFESTLLTDFFVIVKLLSCFEFSKRWKSNDVLIPALVFGLNISKWLSDFLLPFSSVDEFVENKSGDEPVPVFFSRHSNNDNNNNNNDSDNNNDNK